ncbi:GNAT family N-acetyltransferase [Pseudodesulfovibrio senegalensis]|uniref:GNAT family N-acetyltransferase n=2 Tax=Pseudodesulfovibrio senegalensis TaxID=1721087 RepID=A0A6N6N4S0_9BACT|nr:GNAT family N-acetyltransferase [Pseudodesulfovibrio senegalensis]
MLRSRDFLKSDIPVICGFPRNPQELFHMFPAATWPLTPLQLARSADSRHGSTVVDCDEVVAGYANFVRCVPGDVCVIGNVIVNPAMRRQGVGTFLVRAMAARAAAEYGAHRVRLRCVASNEAGLHLYSAVGFRRVGVRTRMGLDGAVWPVHVLEMPLDPGMVRDRQDIVEARAVALV